MSGIAGCSAFGPYVTDPLEPVIRDKVAICYDGTAHSLPTVQKAAQEDCGPGTLADLLDIDPTLYHCPLPLPTRATFVCQPKE